MILNAVPWSNGRPIWLGIEQLVKCYGRVKPRCLIVWGGRDEMFGVSMGYKRVEQIRQAWLRTVRAGMHCLPTEHPAACAALIREFLAGTGQSPRIARVMDGSE